MEELKSKWNKGLIRIKKAEKLAKENPDEFLKHIKLFNDICKEMSSLMNEYQRLEGKQMPVENIFNGFKSI